MVELFQRSAYSETLSLVYLDMADNETLLTPISETNPVGRDLREESDFEAPYFQLKSQRNTARSQERKSIESGNVIIDPELWQGIIDSIPNLLETQTKDVELTVWYLEALVRKNHWKGLTQGLQLLGSLLDTFGKALYPKDEDDDFSTTLISIASLSGGANPGTLITPIFHIPVTEAKNKKQFSIWQYLQSAEVDKLKPKEKSQRLKQGAVELTTIKAHAKQTSQAFIETLKTDITAARTAFDDFSTILDRVAESDAPSLTNLRKCITESQRVIETLYSESNNAVNEGTNENATPEEGDTTQVSPTTLIPGEYHQSDSSKLTREAALTQIQKLADFFKASEPHSPLGYSLQRMVRWGEMLLPELMQEMIIEQRTQEDYYRIAGVNAKDFKPIPQNTPPQDQGAMQPPPMDYGAPPPPPDNYGAPPPPPMDYGAPPPMDYGPPPPGGGFGGMGPPPPMF